MRVRIYLFVMLSVVSSCALAKEISDYSPQARQAMLRVLRNPELKGKFLGSAERVGVQKETLWDQFTDWIDSWF